MNWRKHAFLFAHDAIGSGLRGFHREFLNAERWPAAELETLHRDRLSVLLHHAAKNVPFYRNRVGNVELSSFPVLRKEDVHAHFEQLMEPALLAEYKAEKKPKGYSWVEVKTGGSTGTPTVVVHDRNFRDWGRAARLYSQHLCGFPPGTPFFLLWGSMRDINESRDSLPRRVLTTLLAARPLNAFLMDEARMAAYAQEMRASRIAHLMAYADAACELARFLEKSGTPAPKLDSIMACAGTVTDEMRATLSRVFGTAVHNKYGSRECADMACECAAGGFHIYHTGVHLEVVDERGRPAPPGTTGRILVTLLLNRRFPIIRYEIGDIGALSAQRCACGSPLPLLDRVEGRTSEVVTSTSGAQISPVFIRHLIGVVHNSGALGKFQFVQRGAEEYSLAMQMDAGFADDAFAKVGAALRRDLEKVLGAGARLTIRRVDDIPAPESGKVAYIRNLHAASS